MKRVLDWSGISWEDFQILTLEIAENKLPGILLDEYAAPGGAQKGIDLIQRNKSDGGKVMIQCKHEKKLTRGDINLIIKKFLEGDHSQTCTELYIATTSPLRSLELLRILEGYKKKLKDRNIDFDWWDRTWIELHLRSMHPVVANFFSPDIADDFCNDEVGHFPQAWELPASPIQRKLHPAVSYKSKEEAFWMTVSRESISLSDLFKKNRLSLQRICVVAEPYQGKSVYVRQCAHELMQSGEHFQPVILDMKGHNVEPIANMLDQEFRGWRSIPYKNLVLIIDGMDEAPTQDFIKLARYIAQFAKSYQAIKIVVACRSLFYNYYMLQEEIPSFRLMQLSRLEWENVQRYVKDRLGDRAERFEEEISKKELTHWLFHPFYLVALVDHFQAEDGLPEKKIEVVKEFIEKAFRKARHRVLSDGNRLAIELPRFTEVMEQLAVIMQLNGANALSLNDCGTFFDTKEAELLKHSGLISDDNNTWTFTNAFFQEHLAACYLSRKPLEEILRWCSVGKKVRKIKTKWIQTINSLLSLLEKDTVLYQGLLRFMEEDSIELIFQIEPSLHSDQFKQERLEKLVRFMIENELWPRVVRPETVGLFMAGVGQATGYLLGLMGDKEMPGHVRIFACRVLEAIPSVAAMEREILEFVFYHIAMANHPNLTSELINLLAVHKLGRANDVAKIIAMLGLHQDHRFRTRVYDWIVALGLTREFWQYGIDGIPILVEHNRPTSHGGSELSLADFLLTVSNRSQLYSIFKGMSSGAWHHITGFKDNRETGFLSRLMEKCSLICASDPLAIMAMAEYFRTAGRNFLQEQRSAVDGFLKAIKPQSFLARRLIKDLLGDKSYDLAWLVRQEDLDYLLFEIEEQGYNQGILNGISMGMSSSEINVEEFRERCHDASAGRVFNKLDRKEIAQMEKTEAKRRKNDLICMQSVETFRKGIKKLFSIHKKKTITLAELFDDRRGPRREAACDFIVAYIRQLMGNSSFVSLEECLEQLDEETFSVFRAHEALDYRYSMPETDAIFSLMIKEFFEVEFPKCQFENAYQEEEGRVRINGKLALMGNIFEKLDFPLSAVAVTEMVWLDFGGFQSPGIYPGQRSSIGEKIVSLSENSKELLCKKILANMRLGIQCQTVLKSHVRLCGTLNILEARPILLDIIRERKVDENSLEKVADVYTRLRGNKADLLPFLKSSQPGESFWMYLMEQLKDVDSEMVKKIGCRLLESDPIVDYRTILTSQLLASMGVVDGFLFQVNVLLQTQQASMLLLNNRYQINVKTQSALDGLKDVMHMVADPAYDGIRPPENPEALIAEWLKAFAAKGEDDMMLVIDFLEESERQWSPVFPSAKVMRWYIYSLKEKFRNSQADNNISFDEIKDFVRRPKEHIANLVSLS